MGSESKGKITPALVSELVISGIHTPSDSPQDLVIPHGRKTLLQGFPGSTPFELLNSLFAESRLLLSAITGADVRPMQKLLQWEKSEGLKPVFSLLEDTFPGLNKRRVHSFFFPEESVQELFLESGKPRCKKPSCAVRKILIADLSKEIAERVRHSTPPPRSILLGRTRSLPEETKASKRGKKRMAEDVRSESLVHLESFLVQLSLSGLRRAFVNGQYFRLEDSRSVSEAAFSDEQRRQLERLVSDATGPLEIFAVSQALSSTRFGAEELSAAIETELEQYPELEIALHADLRGNALGGKGNELGERWTARRGFYCADCKQTLPPLSREAILSGNVEWNGFLYDDFFKSSAGELSRVTGEFNEPFRLLALAGLDRIPIDREFHELSSGEKFLLNRLFPLSLGYRDMIIVAESGKGRLDREAKRSLEAIDEKLLENGNTLLIDDSNPGGLGAADSLFLLCSPTSETLQNRGIPGADLPLRAFNLLCGKTGSGKSRLLQKIAESRHTAKKAQGKNRALNSVELIRAEDVFALLSPNQTSLRTVVQVLQLPSALAELYSSLPAARQRGLEAKDLRIDAERGSCPVCKGLGVLSDVSIPPRFFPPCTTCLGLRYSAGILEVAFYGKTLSEVMGLSIADALTLFQHHDSLRRPLEQATLLGLSNIELGAIANFLSPSSKLCLNLSASLSRVGKDKVFLLLDDFLDFLEENSLEWLLQAAFRYAEEGGGILFTARNPERAENLLGLLERKPLA